MATDTTEKELIYRLKAFDESTAVIQRVRAEYKKLAEETQRQAKESAKQWSTNGELGKTLSLLRGGGAVGGITLALGAMKDLTAEAKKLREEFKSTEISAGQIFERLAASIPILGQAWQIGRDIRSLLYPGEDEQDQRQANEAKAENSAYRRRKSLKDRILSGESPESRIQTMRRELDQVYDEQINRTLDVDEAERLIREKQRLRESIDRQEKSEALKKRPAASYSDVLAYGVKLANEAQGTFAKSVIEQMEQAQKAATSALRETFEVEGDPIAAAKRGLGNFLKETLSLGRDAWAERRRNVAPVTGTAPLLQTNGSGFAYATAEASRNQQAKQMLDETRRQTELIRQQNDRISTLITALKRIGVTRL